MGVNIVLWRARIGLFNGSFTGPPFPKVDRSQSTLTSFRLWFICMFFTSFALVLLFMYLGFGSKVCSWLVPAIFLLNVILCGALFWLSLLAVIKTVVKNFKYLTSPICVLYLISVPVSIMIMVPGSLPVCLSLFNPYVSGLILKLAGDIEENPGPKGILNVLYANVNSITAESGHRFQDLALRMKLDNIHIACLSETGSNLDLDSLNIDGYHPLDRSYYKPNNRGLLFFVSDNLSYRRRGDLESDVCMWAEISTNNTCFLTGLFYRSPSQSSAERVHYFNEVDNIIGKALNDKPSNIVFFGGDFNARSQHWWLNDRNTVEGKTLYDVSVKHSLYQLINEPTRVTENSKSCLDLIFCNNPGFVHNTAIMPPISLGNHDRD